MKVLALEAEAPGARPEAERLWQLQQEGWVRAAYFRADRRTAVLELECADGAEASRALATLPLVQAGLIAFDVVPLRPYDGTARLFGA